MKKITKILDQLREEISRQDISDQKKQEIRQEISRIESKIYGSILFQNKQSERTKL